VKLTDSAGGWPTLNWLPHPLRFRRVSTTDDGITRSFLSPDLVEKIQRVSDPTGTYGFAYDNMGRLIGTTTQYTFLPGHSFQNSYTYDAASNRTSLTAPDGSTNSYQYDALNRLTTLTNSLTGQFGFSGACPELSRRNALSRRTQLTRPNGVKTNYTRLPPFRSPRLAPGTLPPTSSPSRTQPASLVTLVLLPRTVTIFHFSVLGCAPGCSSPPACPRIIRITMRFFHHIFPVPPSQTCTTIGAMIPQHCMIENRELRSPPEANAPARPVFDNQRSRAKQRRARVRREFRAKSNLLNTLTLRSLLSKT
jgi:YD repeat-containing protein